MRKLFFILIALVFVTISSCDDGDIITVELEFGETFEACEGVNDLVLYKLKDDPSESLSVLISNYTLEELLEINNNTEKMATLNYRTYAETSLPNNLFCNEIPINVNIRSDNESMVTAVINTTLVEDDNDGIPAELESTNGINPIADDDNDGVLNYLDDAPNDDTIGNDNDLIEPGFDTDGDGLPNYIDADDDGDNVPTKDENPDPNDDGNFNDAQDTDGDNTPDYLDADDDGDGTLTRNEEKGTPDQNPKNDITNPDVGPDYLNPDVSDVLTVNKYREHTILQTFAVSVVLNGVDFDFLNQEPFQYGVLQNAATSNTRMVTPEFN